MGGPCFQRERLRRDSLPVHASPFDLAFPSRMENLIASGAVHRLSLPFDVSGTVRAGGPFFALFFVPLSAFLRHGCSFFRGHALQARSEPLFFSLGLVWATLIFQPCAGSPPVSQHLFFELRWWPSFLDSDRFFLLA